MQPAPKLAHLRSFPYVARLSRAPPDGRGSPGPGVQDHDVVYTSTHAHLTVPQ